MSVRSIGTMIDELHDIREEKRAAEQVVKEIEERYAKLESELIQRADEEGISSGKGKLASFSVGESIMPHVKDWGAFYKFIYKHGYGHLLERRPSVVACRELFDTKGDIPGVEKFVKRKLNLRTTST